MINTVEQKTLNILNSDLAPRDLRDKLKDLHEELSYSDPSFMCIFEKFMWSIAVVAAHTPRNKEQKREHDDRLRDLRTLCVNRCIGEEVNLPEKVTVAYLRKQIKEMDRLVKSLEELSLHQSGTEYTKTRNRIFELILTTAKLC